MIINFILKNLFGYDGNLNKVNFKRLIEEGGIDTVMKILSEWISMVFKLIYLI